MTIEFDRPSGEPIGYMIACPICARRLLLVTEPARSRPRRFVIMISNMAERPSVFPAIQCSDCHLLMLIEDGIAHVLPTRRPAA
jgi:uncharacterized protein YbaR (Trm112 family)